MLVPTVRPILWIPLNTAPAALKETSSWLASLREASASIKGKACDTRTHGPPMSWELPSLAGLLSVGVDGDCMKQYELSAGATGSWAGNGSY